MFAETPENFAIIRDLGVTLFGMGRRFRRRAERMSPNDRVLFYVKGIRKWPASATITSECFEDDSEVFVSNDSRERFPFRVKLRPNIVLDEQDYIDAMLLAPRLDYVRRWEPKDWPLAFFDRLHLLPQKDFRLIEGEMERIKRNNRRSSPTTAGGAELSPPKFPETSLTSLARPVCSGDFRVVHLERPLDELPR